LIRTVNLKKKLKFNERIVRQVQTLDIFTRTWWKTFKRFTGMTSSDTDIPVLTDNNRYVYNDFDNA